MLSLIVSIDSGKVWWKIVPKLELMVGGAKMSRKLWAVSCELRECHESRGWGCLFLVARDSNLETKKAPTMSRLIFERVLKWCGKNIIWCTAVKGRVHETPFWVHERVESCKLRATSCEKREARSEFNAWWFVGLHEFHLLWRWGCRFQMPVEAEYQSVYWFQFAWRLVDRANCEFASLQSRGLLQASHFLELDSGRLKWCLRPLPQIQPICILLWLLHGLCNQFRWKTRCCLYSVRLKKHRRKSLSLSWFICTVIFELFNKTLFIWNSFPGMSTAFALR